MKLILSKYGNVIATKNKSEEVYNEIKSGLDRDEEIIIDAKDVLISTQASGLIFGRLYIESKDKYNTNVKFINNDAIFNFNVNAGISDAVDILINEISSINKNYSLDNINAMKLTLSKYGIVIASDNSSEEVYNEIRSRLDRDEDIIIDAKDVSITILATRLIFGRLYIESKDKYNSKVKFINNDTIFNFKVNEGIYDAIENKLNGFN